MADNKRVRVIAPQERRAEVSSGAMSRVEGVSEILTGAEGIHLAMATIQPGGRSSPDFHVACDSAIYVIQGHGVFLMGEGLEESLDIRQDDFIYVPPGVVHAPVNTGSGPLELIVARNTPVEVVVEWDPAARAPLGGGGSS